MKNTGYIFDLKRYSINDGPGIRTTVFFKGCPLNCIWCHNPESRNMLPEKVDIVSNTWSIYSQSCDPQTIGKEATPEEILTEIEKDTPFYEESGGGVTISGGEPLMQTEFLLAILKMCREKNIHTAVDTSGYSPLEKIKKIFSFTDLFLFDIKILNEALHKKYTGVSNKLILENLKWLAEMSGKIIVRIPIIPQINDDPENIAELVQFLKYLNIREINLLPYHDSADSKYSRLKMENKVIDVQAPSAAAMDSLKIVFSATGKNVSVGG